MGNRWGNSGNSVRFILGGSKITADGDCSQEIKRRLLLGRKVMTNLDSIFKSTNESTLRMRWPNYWNFSFSISPSNEHSGQISFRMDWLDLLAVRRTLRSLLQHYSSKASVLPCSAFFIVQLSHPYMITAKTMAERGRKVWHIDDTKRELAQA